MQKNSIVFNKHAVIDKLPLLNIKEQYYIKNVSISSRKNTRKSTEEEMKLLYRENKKNYTKKHILDKQKIIFGSNIYNNLEHNKSQMQMQQFLKNYTTVQLEDRVELVKTKLETSIGEIDFNNTNNNNKSKLSLLDKDKDYKDYKDIKTKSERINHKKKPKISFNFNSISSSTNYFNCKENLKLNTDSILKRNTSRNYHLLRNTNYSPSTINKPMLNTINSNRGESCLNPNVSPSFNNHKKFTFYKETINSKILNTRESMQNITEDMKKILNREYNVLKSDYYLKLFRNSNLDDCELK
jgi:hypothetical protein